MLILSWNKGQSGASAKENEHRREANHKGQSMKKYRKTPPARRFIKYFRAVKAGQVNRHQRYHTGRHKGQQPGAEGKQY